MKKIESRKVQEIRETSLGWGLNVLTRTMNRVMKKELGDLDLTMSQFAILMTLLENDGISQTEIGNKVVLPGYAMTRNIDGLEKQALIKRQQDENSRRAHCVVVTQEGWKLAPRIFKVIEKVNNKFFSALDEEEAEQLMRLMIKVINDKEAGT